MALRDRKLLALTETAAERERWWDEQLEDRDDWKHSFLEFNTLVRGKKLGRGMTRTVYEYNPPLLPLKMKCVLKVEKAERNGHFQNVAEWKFWEDYKDDPRIARWLAPCYAISAGGTYLIQARTTRVALKDLPARVPKFFSDMKPTNYGLWQGKLVCHDYGTTPHGKPPLKLKKADWLE